MCGIFGLINYNQYNIKKQYNSFLKGKPRGPEFSILKNNFPETLLISREPIAWGPTNEVLIDKNMLKARQMVETWDEHSIIYNRDVT